MLRFKPWSPILLLGALPVAVSAAPVTQVQVREIPTTAQVQPRYAESAQSELVILVQQLQAEVRELRGQVEEQQHRLQQMERDQRDRYRDIDRRLSAIINAAAPASASGGLASMGDVPQSPPTGAAAATASGATADAAAPAPAEAPAAGEQQAYQAAFALVRARQFEEARKAFESFIQQYPQSDHLANAYYWIGEVDLAQQKPADARDAFNRVVTDFPDHIKVPDALYKLGIAYDQLGDAAASRQAFSRVIKEFPQSSAAGLARNYVGQ